MQSRDYLDKLAVAANQSIKEREYWLRQLAGDLVKSSFPYDYKKSRENKVSFETLRFKITGELFSRIIWLSNESDYTLHIYLLAVLSVLVDKYTSNKDIIVGVPIYKQENEGEFINTILPIRSQLEENMTFKELLLQVSETIVRAVENQSYPIEILLKQLNMTVPGNENSFPLFDIAILLENIHDRRYIRHVNLNMIFSFSRTGEWIEGVVEYNSSNYDKITVERIINHLINLMQEALFHVDLKPDDMDILSAKEKNQLLLDFNDTLKDIPDFMLHQLFEKQAGKAPDNIAVIGMWYGAGGSPQRPQRCTLTYRELNRKSNQLAHLLREKGIKPDTIVGIIGQRSIEMLVGIFGILKAGGAYLPINPEYPAERIKYIIDNSAAKLLLTLGSLAAISGNQCESMDLQEVYFYKCDPGKLAPINTSTGLAYVIYTSGSTGKPKGVMIRHRSVVNRLNWMQRFYPLAEEEVILQKTPVVFDVSVWELFWWSGHGASVCLLAQKQEKNPASIIDAIEKNNITKMHFVPSMLNAFLQYLEGAVYVADRLKSLKQVFASGEVLTVHHVERFARILSEKNETKLINLYGPTEATVDVSYFNCSTAGDLRTVPIGKPIDNINLYIVNKGLRLQAIGIVGELCISGIGLAAGYLNSPGLTLEKFVRNPYVSGKLVYKTGDMARWLPDGNIQFLGREDHQVKIRGFRIELGEIEDRLLRHKHVKDAVIISRSNEAGNQFLCAYVVITNSDVTGFEIMPDSTEFKGFLSQTLPDYMIPSYFIQLEEVPVTVTGKLDRNALPEPEVRLTGEGYVPPANELEEKLARIWQGVLGIEKIGITDNFFQMGGDSIKAIQAAARLKKYNLDLEVNDLFSNPTIRLLVDARAVVRSRGKIPQGLIEGEVELTPIQHWFFESNFTDCHHFNQAVVLYRRQGFDEGTLKKVFAKIVSHHDALRMVYIARGKERDRVLPVNRGLERDLFHLEVNRLENMNKEEVEGIIENKSLSIQKGMNLETGPLVRLGLFKTQEGDYLLIAIHHLVVDGISWRIILEDFSTGYVRANRGEPIRFPGKTHSFKAWAKELQEFAKSPERLNQLSYWREIDRAVIKPLPKDNEPAPGKLVQENIETQTLTLTPGESSRLLKEVHHAYTTEINDILLAALSAALAGWANTDKVLISLEGHGREEIIPGIDISRTVGWFTSRFPVVLDTGQSHPFSYPDWVKQVKETLRKIPNRGIGYGILQYLTPLEIKKESRFKLEPEVSFNYLGQFQQEGSSGLFEFSNIKRGNTVSKKARQVYTLDINSMVVGERFNLVFSYNKFQYRGESIKKLLNSYRSHLLAIIEHCMQRKETDLTPSDLGYRRISIRQLDELKQWVGRDKVIRDIYPLSPMQGGMYFIIKMEEESQASAYFEQLLITLGGEIEISRLEASLNWIIRRYDILRTLFVHEGWEEPLQIVLKHRPLTVRFEDISHLPTGKKDSYLEEYRRKDRQQGFNLSRDILIRISLFLVQAEPRKYKLLWSHSHILMDGWCLGILFKALIRFYRELASGSINSREFPPVIPYRRYIEWLRTRDKKEDLNYWSKYLEEYTQAVNLPSTPAKKEKTGEEGKPEFENYYLDFSAELSGKVEQISRGNQVTMNTLFQTLWGILLQRYNNSGDVVFGAVVSGRPPEIEGIEQMVGLFINTIPVRIRTGEIKKISLLIRQVQEQAIKSKPHEYVPLVEIQTVSPLKNQLIRQLMIFENYPIDEELKRIVQSEGPTGPGFAVEGVETREQTNYDFNLVILSAETIRIRFNYNTRVYSKQLIKRVAGHLREMVRQVTVEPDLEIDDIDILTGEEKQKILYDFNNTRVDYPADRTLHELFAQQAEVNPGLIAVVGPQQSHRRKNNDYIQLTYSQLNQRSHRLAQYLREKGVRDDTIIGLMVERSVEMIAGILGILKAGGAYMPICPDYPEERIDYMLADSSAGIILTSRNIPGAVTSAKEILYLSDRENHAPAALNPHLSPWVNSPPTSLAYVIYTSGTTGQPKGVMMHHRGAVNVVTWFGGQYEVKPGVHVLNMSDYTFDASVNQIFGTLLHGGAVHVISTSLVTDIARLQRYIEDKQIHIIYFVPVLLKELLGNIDKLKTLGIVISGAEKLSDAVKDKILARGYILYNHYGPTETAVDALACRCSAALVTLGTPIPNTMCYILDKKGKFVPVGVPGELVITGTGVSRGYINKPELTAEKFDRDLWDYQEGYHRSNRSYKTYITGKNHLESCSRAAMPSPHLPVYRTGDLARWLPDGNVEFLGRRDQQVKLRGYRIELAEIENRLLSYPTVKHTVVTVYEDETGEKNLCAYIVGKETARPEQTLNIIQLREYLSKTLPAYMLPAYFSRLDRLPLLPSGKVDRKALPEPRIKYRSQYISPQNETERILVKLWSEVLGIEKDKISITDDFFELGGHSLRAIRVTSRVHKEFDVKLTLTELFKHPTIKDLARYIKNAVKKRFTSINLVEKKEYYKLSSAQKRLYFLQQMDPEGTAYNMPVVLILLGQLEEKKFREAFKKLIESHESLRTSFMMWSDEPVQHVHDEVEFEIEYHQSLEREEESPLSNGQGKGEVSAPIKIEKIIREFLRPFDLSCAPLLRVRLIKLSEKEHTWMVDMHHIISDGVSHDILVRDFITLYKGSQLPGFQLQYKEYSEWQNDELESGVMKIQGEYWKNMFENEVPVLDLPSDFPRPPVPGFAGNRVNFEIEKKELEKLIKIAAREGATTYMVLLAVFNIFLLKLCGQEDIVVGSPAASRRHLELEQVIGMFVNTLPLRNYPGYRKTFTGFLKEVRENTVKAFENQDYPFEKMVENFNTPVQRDISRNPLFDVMFALQNFEIAELNLPGLKIMPYKYESNNSLFDLSLTVWEKKENLLLSFEYSTILFKRETVERFINYFKKIAATVAENPGVVLSQIEITGEEEKYRLLVEFNDSWTDYPHNKVMPEFIEAQVERTPDSVAVVGAAAGSSHMVSVSYKELNREANLLALRLKEKGVTPDSIVGIMTAPSVEMITGILGIWKAGGAYLPIDPGYPEERINYMLKDSSARVLLKGNSVGLKKPGTNPTAQNQAAASIVLDFEHLHFEIFPNSEFRTSNLNASKLAYVIYTSGSTGKPKGVMIEHRSIVEYIFTIIDMFKIDGRDIVLQQISLSFDASMEEIYPTLFKGARMVVGGNEIGRDIERFATKIEQEQITLVSVSPLLLNEINKVDSDRLQSIRLVLVGGDVVKPEFIDNIIKHRWVYDGYGPTEATVCATFYKCSESDKGNIPIGKPIGNMRVYIVGKDNNLVPIGVPGEIRISGDGVARGYLNNPELTAERFKRAVIGHSSFVISSTLKTNDRLYLTGDLGRWLPDGNIQFWGRIDQQVKVRGYRIELAEIENCLLAHEDIKEVVVTTKEDINKEIYLSAYIAAAKKLTIPGLKTYLSGKLPAYMIPAQFMQLETIPLTRSGKVDRKALSALGISLGTGVQYISPRNDIEKKLVEAWTEILGRDSSTSIGIHDNFFDMGGSSFSLIRLNSRLKKDLKIDIPIVTLFNYPTIASLADYLVREEISRLETGQPGKQERSQKPLRGMEIAVIGMAGRFPGAQHIDEFWNNLKNGVESVTFYTLDELREMGVPAGELDNPNYVPARGILQDKYNFDAWFFGYTPAEAAIMDPQIRIFHECCWEALENAGYDPDTYEGTIGMYAGATSVPYWEIQPVLKSISGNNNDSVISGVEKWDAAQFSSKDFLSTRIAYKLNLKGPCVSLQTACSTSLAAVDLACQALIGGKCEMILAGGVTVSIFNTGYLYQEGTILSPDGHCRAFDARTGGTVGGEGAGVVVLKPLAEAAADHDNIYAVIKGFAINNDGKNKVGFTAPSVEGQVRVIRQAHRQAGMQPESIGYIETHGTGTLLGDSIEIEGLKQAFKNQGPHQRKYCAIGSIKTNIGHLDTASGIVGFIKTILILKHRLIPPSLHFEQANPAIHLEESPFYVNTRLLPWKNEKYPLRAGVNSLGLGGTNVHIILEQWSTGSTAFSFPRDSENGIGSEFPPISRDYQLILLSAKTPDALDNITINLARHLKQNPGINLADTAYTLQIGRKAFAYREMLVCPTNNVREAVRALEAGEAQTGLAGDQKPTVVFMFSGQGSQYVNMGLDLYNTEPVFRNQVDHCFKLLDDITGIKMKSVLYPGNEETEVEKANEKIHQFLYTTPIKFIFEYSLAVLLMKRGISPDVMMGHSFGEYAAACLSGVFSLEDALFIAALRGKLMHGLPPGTMLSVPISQEELNPLLNGKISLAAVNGEAMCVVSGPVEAIADFEKRLQHKGYECLRYRVPKAGHSWMVEPILKEFKNKLERVKFKKPQIPFLSGVTGTWITDRQAVDPEYWTQHLRKTVRFAQELTTLLTPSNQWATGRMCFLEVGPGRGLTLFVNQHPDKKDQHHTFNLVRHRKEKVSDVYYTLTQLGDLWMHGIPLDSRGFYPGQTRRRVPLPTYPFEKDTYRPPSDLFNLNLEKLGKRSVLNKKSNMEDWFYVPLWERSPLPPGSPGSSQTPGKQCCLVFSHKTGTKNIDTLLVEQLKQKGYKVITVTRGTSFKQVKEGLFSINPDIDGDYHTLLTHLHARLNDGFPRRLIHLWGTVDPYEPKVEEVHAPGINRDEIERDLNVGYYSLIYLARALGNLEITDNIHIDVVTSGVHDVTGEERLSPGKAAVLGPIKVIPQENPHIRCRHIDIAWPKTGRLKETLPEQLLEEILTGPADTIIAYRNGYRWIQSVTPVRIPPPPGNKKTPLLKKKGVYLLTGGLGGIGLILAQHLASTRQAKLILTGRSEFPSPQQWDQWLHSHSPDDNIARKIQKLKKMEENGAQVMVLAADVSQYQPMKEKIKQAEEKFGPINGIIHCAVCAGKYLYRTVKEISDRDCREQFNPKIQGLLVLEQLLQERELDFCLLMSSTSAILGGLGFAAYSAANNFMDAFVHLYNRFHSTRWISVNWDGWQTETVKTKSDSAKSPGTLGASITELSMTPQEGAEAFERILAWPTVRQVIHSAGDLQIRIDQWIKLESVNHQPRQPGEKHLQQKNRPKLSTTYAAPTNGLEETLVGIWGELLGYNQVGIRDNFFELGGDSLKAVIAISRIQKALDTKIPLKDFFAQPFIEAHAGYVGRDGKSTYSPVKPIEKKEYYPLSSAQKRMFIANQLERENQSTAYHINTIQVLEGELDRQKLARTFKQLVSRHESFRTAFVLIEGEPVQRVYDKVDFEIEEERSSRFEGTRGLAPLPTGPADRRPHLVTTLISSFIHPFDLSRAPLLRVELMELPHTPVALRDHPSQEGREQKHILMVDMHHIISDGTSLGILVKEFITLYQEESLPPLRIRYKDYQAWQTGEKSREALQTQEKYWLKEFETGCPELNLPLDFQRPANRDFQGSHIAFRVGPAQLDRLKALATGEESTLFMVLLSIYTILISMISTREDIVVGTGVAGRRHSDLEHIIGMFINMLPIRNYPGGEKPFIKFLQEVKKHTLEAFENQDYPYEELVSKVNAGKRQANQNAVFDVVFELQTMEIPFVRIPGLEIKSYPQERRLSRFDMSWVGEEVDGELIFDVEYRTKLFKKETIQGFIGFFKEILAAVLEDREILLKDIRISHGLLSPKSQKPDIRLRF